MHWVTGAEHQCNTFHSWTDNLKERSMDVKTNDDDGCSGHSCIAPMQWVSLMNRQQWIFARWCSVFRAGGGAGTWSKVPVVTLSWCLALTSGKAFGQHGHSARTSSPHFAVWPDMSRGQHTAEAAVGNHWGPAQDFPVHNISMPDAKQNCWMPKKKGSLDNLQWTVAFVQTTSFHRSDPKEEEAQVKHPPSLLHQKYDHSAWINESFVKMAEALGVGKWCTVQTNKKHYSLEKRNL